MVTVVRACTGLTLLVILYMGATAGEIFTVAQPWLMLHGAGAIVLHVLTGVTVVAVFLVQRASGGSLTPVIVAAAIFVATFLQALAGTIATLWIHFPFAVLITLATAWVHLWSLGRVGDRALAG